MRHNTVRVCLLSLGVHGLGQAAPDAAVFDDIANDYEKRILPLVEAHCLDCHDTATKKGELDLERFGDLPSIRTDAKTWQHVLEQLENGEMPPKKKNRKQPSDEDRAALIAWTKRYLDAEARAGAGDPGPVVLRRLSNAEYTYSVRDITGVASLDPLREFPVDSASGEGFTNAGGALVMSPALFEKYLEAGKQVASHAVLLPDGFRFSARTSRSDHANELLAELRAFYLEVTGGDRIDFSYRDQVRKAAPEGQGEGRVNLEPYFAALIANRERLAADSASAGEIATVAQINPKYFSALARMLTSPDSGSFLLDHLRARVRTAKPGDAAVLATEVRTWQDRLWTFQNVGHLGLIRPWQIPVSPLATSREFRVKITPETKSIFLSSRAFGEQAVVQWLQPRFERPGSPPVLLRDLPDGYAELKELRARALAATSRYLAAVFELRQAGEDADPAAVATAHKLEPAILTAWASYLGLEHAAQVTIKDYLTQKIPRAGAYDFVKGWTLPGVKDFSLLGNSSDRNVKIPGDMRAHKITVHPRPERWIAAGWMSPMTGVVRLTASVRDAHNNCGNGVSWWLELRRGSTRRILRSGNVDLGKAALSGPIDGFEIKKGDLVSIIIGARDGSHVCDLTEIDLSIAESGGKKRTWLLSGDCANDIHAGNPHPDRLGNLAVWHFYGGMNDERKAASAIPPESLLWAWSQAKEPAQAQELASAIQKMLTSPAHDRLAAPDLALHRTLTSSSGPLFRELDFAELAGRRQQQGIASFEPKGNRVVTTPSSLEFPLPTSLLAGTEFVVRGIVHESSNPTAVTQLQAGVGTPPEGDQLRSGDPILIREGAGAKAPMEKAFAEFRELFPAAMCYARVVPADEVVTLLLYHREDEHLSRLMLSDVERERLDRLWDALTFVSREPLRLVTAYEQIWQFATQDADPKKFEPLETTIRERAARFEEALRLAESHHLDRVIEFAKLAYRRSDIKEAPLRNLYQRLRKKEIGHEEAIRLTIAHLFTSPAFLYKAETPSPGPGQGPVSDWELATRLSYFLTSSAPDPPLVSAAMAGAVTDPKMLLDQTHRLLKDERSRRLAIHFGCQWLHIRDFDQHDEKNERLYPDFAKLRGSMNEESVRFFTDFFQNDRSILSLLAADHSFVDASLAAFYGLPEAGDGWRRVEGTRTAGRGGILGMATTLAKQSGASRTSPILRGNWVYETLLGGHTPKPPKDVPVLPDIVPDGLSERELIEKHSSDPACAKCHARIDPFGFALEAFDTIGRRRTAANTSATLPDGATIDGLDGLRTYLLTTQRDTFVRHFCQKLLGYALGRAVQLSDEPLLDEIMTKLEKNDYRVWIAIEAIILSRQFREIRGADRP